VFQLTVGKVLKRDRCLSGQTHKTFKQILALKSVLAANLKEEARGFITAGNFTTVSAVIIKHKAWITRTTCPIIAILSFRFIPHDRTKTDRC
jgi:hypothetical protein